MRVVRFVNPKRETFEKTTKAIQNGAYTMKSYRKGTNVVFVQETQRETQNGTR